MTLSLNIQVPGPPLRSKKQGAPSVQCRGGAQGGFSVNNWEGWQKREGRRWENGKKDRARHLKSKNLN